VLSPIDTAYPILKESPTGRELQELFTPNLLELGFARENTRQPVPRLGLLLLLKSFQKLGYFVRLAEIPPPIVLHIAKAFPNSGHIYTFIGTAHYAANLPFGVVPQIEHKKELLREIGVLKSLLQQVEDDLAIETTPPLTSAAADFWSDLHPEINRVSQDLFKGGHYAKSVLAALVEINDQVKRVYKQRTGQEKDGSDLMKQAFSPNNRVIALGDLSTKSGQDTQLGFMEIFSGAVTGIRNPNAHENLTLTENEAKHYLYLASLLMKIFRDGVSGRLHQISSTP
jgi:uncharacterized protein (TIGR02391 family)